MKLLKEMLRTYKAKPNKYDFFSTKNKKNEDIKNILRYL